MRLKSFVLIEKEGKYLLIQEASEKWREKWYLPGGSLKDAETLQMGALREVREEAGCEVHLKSVFFVKYHKGFFNRKITVYFCAEMIGEKIKTIADDESLDVKWFSYEEIDKLSVRKNLKELITIYRGHTNFLPADEFMLADDQSGI